MFVMFAKMMSFLQLAAKKKIHFGEHDKQIFGPSYFVRALGNLSCCMGHIEFEYGLQLINLNRIY